MASGVHKERFLVVSDREQLAGDPYLSCGKGKTSIPAFPPCLMRLKFTRTPIGADTKVASCPPTGLDGHDSITDRHVACLAEVSFTKSCSQYHKSPGFFCKD